jgi:hypothetical protein
VAGRSPCSRHIRDLRRRVLRLGEECVLAASP